MALPRKTVIVDEVINGYIVRYYPKGCHSLDLEQSVHLSREEVSDRVSVCLGLEVGRDTFVGPGDKGGTI